VGEEKRHTLRTKRTHKQATFQAFGVLVRKKGETRTGKGKKNPETRQLQSGMVENETKKKKDGKQSGNAWPATGVWTKRNGQ